MFRLLDEAVKEGKSFCAELEINLEQALEANDVFEKVSLFEGWEDRLLASDENRKNFKVYENTIRSLYEASKPEVLGQPIVRMVSVFQYLRGVLDSVIERQDIDSAVQRVGGLLDESLVVEMREVKTGFRIAQSGKTSDLSKIDFEKLKGEFKAASYKNIEITDLRSFLESKLEEMLNQNSEQGEGFVSSYRI